MAHLPGQRFKCTDNEICEDCDKPATWTLVGETDSFGSEYIYLCDEHMEKFDEEQRNADHSGTCEWCKQHKPLLRPTRDIDEGSSGPVYDVCTECRIKQDEEASAELDYLDGRAGFDDDDCGVDDDEEPEPPEYYIVLLAQLEPGVPYHYYLSIETDPESGVQSYKWCRKFNKSPSSVWRWMLFEDAEVALAKVMETGGTFETGEPWNRTIDIKDVVVEVTGNYGAL